MKITIVQTRGRARGKALQTLKFLGLNKKNSCVTREDSPSLKGMLKVAEPFITWGKADEKTAEIIKKRKNLHPPRKGYPKGVKMHFRKGGAYGNREEKINELIQRMT